MEKIRIREGKNSDPRSGISIPDWQHCLLDTVIDCMVFNVSPVIRFIIIWLIRSAAEIERGR